MATIAIKPCQLSLILFSLSLNTIMLIHTIHSLFIRTNIWSYFNRFPFSFLFILFHISHHVTFIFNLHNQYPYPHLNTILHSPFSILHSPFSPLMSLPSPSPPTAPTEGEDGDGRQDLEDVWTPHMSFISYLLSFVSYPSSLILYLLPFIPHLLFFIFYSLFFILYSLFFYLSSFIPRFIVPHSRSYSHSHFTHSLCCYNVHSETSI